MKLFAFALIAAILPSWALADATAGAQKSASCSVCHGIDGNSPSGVYPNLAGQTPQYLYKQIKDFKERRRPNAIMSTMIASLTEEDMRDLADFFSSQAPNTTPYGSADPTKIAEGKRITEEVKCSTCHLRSFKGNGEIPRVARQQYAYTVKQLKDFRDGRRTNDNGLMAALTKDLTDEQILAIARYVGSLY
jgi:cytochrome c553